MAEKDNEEAIHLNEMITLVATACVLGIIRIQQRNSKKPYHTSEISGSMYTRYIMQHGHCFSLIVLEWIKRASSY
jgi:hypothetical protein